MESEDYSEFDMDFTTHRYPNRWDENNWEEEFEQHPLFMTKVPENNQLPPIVEALQQLKYGKEDNTNDELAENYKKDGNLNFKAKKYQIAIDCYTEAIKLKPKSDELKSVLHSNRSVSHFYLENFRSSLIDSMKAIEFNSKNNKAIERVITCLNKLKKYEELIKFCDNEEIEIINVDQIRKEAEKNLKIKQRDERKNNTKEQKIKNLEKEHQIKVLKELKNRNIIFKGNIFEVVHPGAENYKIIFNDDNTMNYPVLFTYKDFGVCDFIEKFNENSSFIDHLTVMVDDEKNLPEWNVNRKLTTKNAKIEYVDSLNDKFIKIDKNLTLLQVLTKYKLACTKPPEEKKNEVGIHEKKKVEITLGDCLACSGCITSAETVLIQQQSDKQVYSVLKDKKNNSNPKTIVFSLSLQAISSFATKYNLEFQETSEKLCFFFKSIGVDYVYDISFARHLALYESQKDLINRINLNEKNLKNDKLCLLSSICPGFVCYAEKTYGELLVPLLSSVKSPQQIFGSLLKNFWSKLEKIDAKNIYHVSLMPCFDKKLEASRKEFILENDLTEVDCVLTPVELISMFEKEEFDFFNSDKKPLDNFWNYFIEDNLKKSKFQNYEIKSHLGSSSGGYAENVFRMISSVLYNKKLESNKDLDFVIRRNKDFVDLDLSINDEVVFSVAIINGFRNIQTLIQRIKRGSCKYNYVEVMACPSGCINGGGLIKDVSLEISKKLYNNLLKLNLEESFNFDDFYKQWFKDEETIKMYLHTKFNIIPKTKNSININW